MGSSGDTRLTVEAIGLTGQHAPESEAKEHLLQSPSAAANRMLQVEIQGILLVTASVLGCAGTTLTRSID